MNDSQTREAGRKRERMGQAIYPQEVSTMDHARISLVFLAALAWGCGPLPDGGEGDRGEADRLTSSGGGAAGPTTTGSGAARRAYRLAGKGMTWGKSDHLDDLGVDMVSCYGLPRVRGTESCDAYQGDTSCLQALPILCLDPQGLPRPPYEMTGTAHAMSREFYRGWAGGGIGLTSPVRGVHLTSLAAANAVCSQELGPGFRMAEHHDGQWVAGMDGATYAGNSWPAPGKLQTGGWTFYAYGDIAGDSRFWVHIDDQPANCWD